MPFNALLLPLLGGYVFVSRWNYTRFNAKRYSGERLIINSALAGFVFLAISYALCHTAAHYWPATYRAWHRAIPYPHTATSVLALALGCAFWWPLNIWPSKLEREIERTINKWNDYLEILLFCALRNSRTVRLTLEGGKVYVGLVADTFDPAYDRRYVTVLPTLSGYRDPVTHKLNLTTDYTSVYRAMTVDDEGKFDYRVIIPAGKVLSASYFDPEAYAQFVARGVSPDTSGGGAPNVANQ